MAELTELQIKERDIDWYCCIGGHPVHIASMGGMIPKTFRERGKLRMLQDAVAKIEPFTEVRLNMEIIHRQVAKGYEYLQDESLRRAIENANKNNPGFLFLEGNELAVRLFASTFVEKARRGFRSFARKEDGDADGNEYVMIAEPVSPVEYKAGEYQLMELRCKVENSTKSIIIDNE